MPLSCPAEGLEEHADEGVRELGEVPDEPGDDRGGREELPGAGHEEDARGEVPDEPGGDRDAREELVEEEVNDAT